MNKVILSGRLTRDPELSYTAKKGTAVSRFGLAVNRPFKKDEVDFLNCKAFGKTAETIAQYLIKGKPIIVNGSIQSSSYEKDGVKKYITEIIIESFEFLASSNKNDSNNAANKELGLEEVMPEDEIDMPF